MSKVLKKGALIIGVAALAVTGIGLLVAPTAAGILGGISAAAASIGTSALSAIGFAGVAIGTTPKSPSIESTGAAARGRAYADPNALGTFVFGRTLVPLALVFEENHGDDDEYISNVFAHAWHEISAYNSLVVEGETVSFSGDDATGDFSGILSWYRKTGAPGQTAIALANTEWPATTPNGEGVAYSAMVWNFKEQTKLKGGVPNQLEIEVDGALLYDPRLDNDYGSGTHDFDDPTTWEFPATNWGNAVLVVLRFLIGETSSGGDLIWGRGATEAEIDMDTFTAMADVADETVDSKPRFRLGGMHELDGGWDSFVSRWEQETGGKIYKSGGKYGIWLPHDDLTAATTIAESMFLTDLPVRYVVAGSIANWYNTARGRYIEPTEGYRAFPYPAVDESAIVADEGVRLVNLEFSWVQDVELAQRIARIKERRSRYQRVWTVFIGWSGQGPTYAPFSVHNLNCKETNDTNQLVRVIERQMSASGVTMLVLQEEATAIYDDTVALGTEYVADQTGQRVDRLGTVTPRYIDRSAIGAGTLVLALELRSSDLTTAAIGEVALVGVDSDGNPLAASDGFFFWQGNKITVPHDNYSSSITIATQLTHKRGFMCYDTSESNPFNDSGGANAASAAFAYQDYDGQWYFDDNTTAPVAFTPDENHVALGWLETGAADNILGGGLFDRPVTLQTAALPGARIGGSQGLINASLETGRLDGWRPYNGAWDVDDSEPQSGKFHLYIGSADAGQDAVNIGNDGRFPVDEGEIIDASAHVQRTGSAGAEARTVYARIQWRNAAETVVGTSASPGTESTSYNYQRVIAPAPSGAVTGEFQIHSPAHTGDDQGVYADGAHMVKLGRPQDVVLRQSAAPSTTFAGLVWEDTDTEITYRRNDADSAWEQVAVDDLTAASSNAVAEANADQTSNNSQAPAWIAASVSTFSTTGNWDGFSVPPTGNISYIDFDTFVMMFVTSALTGNGNANTMGLSLGTVPAALRPSQNREVPCMLYDSSTDKMGTALFITHGGVSFRLLTDTSTEETTTATAFNSGGGFKGLGGGWICMYVK